MLDLTADKIAKEAGYSVFHFSRIFKADMGISLMDYVKERKLINASKEIFKGEKIIDVAEKYGYETHSGFSKAFKKKFGFTPIQHLIYAIGIIECLKNEREGGFIMSDELKNANVFIEGTDDFVDKDILYKELIRNVKDRYSLEDLKIIENAYNLACKAHEGQYRKSKEQYVTHALCVAIILSQMDVDYNCIVAGLLHDVILKNTSYTLEEIKINFSEEISKLIEDVTNFDIINKDGIDYRVVLIKLADRLHNMRTIKYMEPDRYKEKAKETMEIFSPIAAKYNITKLKTELDDLSWEILI